MALGWLSLHDTSPKASVSERGQSFTISCDFHRSEIWKENRWKVLAHGLSQHCPRWPQAAPSHQTTWLILNPEDPLPKSLTYRAVSLALAVGLGHRRFFSARASPQDSLSPHAVAVAFLRMYHPRDLDGSSSAFYDLTLEAAHAHTAFYRGSVCIVSLTGTGTQWHWRKQLEWPGERTRSSKESEEAMGV